MPETAEPSSQPIVASYCTTFLKPVLMHSSASCSLMA